jgi:hypothetical protein
MGLYYATVVRSPAFQRVNLIHLIGGMDCKDAVYTPMAQVEALHAIKSGIVLNVDVRGGCKMLYVGRSGKKILMVQTWTDQPGYGRNLLRMVLRVYGNRPHPVPQKEADECIRGAIDAILSYNPDVVGLGGKGQTAKKIRSGLEAKGYRGEIGYWGKDEFPYPLLASEFLRGYGVEPPY